MKYKKAAKYTLIGLAAVVLLAALGMVIWSATGTYPARSTAKEAMASTTQITVTRDKWIIFTPAGKPNIGLIFYPGGLVEPQAYAPVLHEIAAEGVLTVITPMPLNLAIFNPDAAGAVIDAYPSIDTWILAGHSLGGAAASIYAANNASRIEGLALWDSFPPDSADLSAVKLPVLSLYGTTNGLPNTDNFDAKRPLLPADAQYEAIEGASHAQFGDYGPQKGDVAPSLSLAAQHQRVTEIMLTFIRNIQ